MSMRRGTYWWGVWESRGWANLRIVLDEFEILKEYTISHWSLSWCTYHFPACGEAVLG